MIRLIARYSLMIVPLAFCAAPAIAQIRPYQQVIVANTLYELHKSNLGSEQLEPSIEVIGGNIALYGSQQKPVSAPTGMNQTNAALTGIDKFGVIPNYIYFTGSVTSVTLSGIVAKAM